MEPMIIATGVFAAVMALLATGALIHRSGVRQGIRMASMAWNLKEGYDPLDEPAKPQPVDPHEPCEETV